jgi:hypothetical protein
MMENLKIISFQVLEFNILKERRKHMKVNIWTVILKEKVSLYGTMDINIKEISIKANKMVKEL